MAEDEAQEREADAESVLEAQKEAKAELKKARKEAREAQKLMEAPTPNEPVTEEPFESENPGPMSSAPSSSASVPDELDNAQEGVYETGSLD